MRELLRELYDEGPTVWVLCLAALVAIVAWIFFVVNL